jgi:hypothetical protein
MLNCCIFFDCHGGAIWKYLRQNEEFMKKYTLDYSNLISINNYVNGNKYSNNTDLIKEHKTIIKNADVLILQIIEKDRGFLNNNEVIQLCKKDCIIIKIPHYRNSVYKYINMEGREDDYNIFKFHPTLKDKWELSNQIKDINNVDETIDIIKKNITSMNNFSRDIEKLKISLNNKIIEFEKIDAKSDIKMLDFYNNNYKKYKLFNSRSYPSSIFFYELTNRILNKLNINYKKKFIDIYFSVNKSEPIPDYWYNFCKFSFSKKVCIYEGIEIEEYEWYYLLLLSNNIDYVNSKEEILRLLDIIRK